MHIPEMPINVSGTFMLKEKVQLSELVNLASVQIVRISN